MSGRAAAGGVVGTWTRVARAAPNPLGLPQARQRAGHVELGGVDRRRKGLCGQRSGRNAARSSAANSSGSSQAAKWPPLSASPK
jgi:hypothetical protein